MTDVLRLDGLAITADARRDPVTLVDAVTLRVGAGEIVGVVGESGSGKSLTALSLLGLVPDSLSVTSRRLEIAGTRLETASQRTWRGVRGRRVAMVHQDPSASLNPARSIGSVMTETARRLTGASRTDARRTVLEALASVGLPHPERIAGNRPFELSGGMRQRVAIATALIADPELLVADEPTTALDATLQAQVLDLLADSVARRGTGLLVITHDFAVAARLCDRIVVMYAGSIVESGPRADVLAAPRHPYTAALLAAVPRLSGPPRARLRSIPGSIPAPGSRPSGCAFAPRCGAATAACATAPSLRDAGQRALACWHPLEAAS